MNCSIGLGTSGSVYEACMISALLYGEKTWALTSTLMDVQCRCVFRMLRYMAVMRWQNRSSPEVAEMCEVEVLSVGSNREG